MVRAGRNPPGPFYSAASTPWVEPTSYFCVKTGEP